MTESTEAFGQGPMDVGVFTDEKNFHES
jgi:hypothetical protein